jgi:hypothetical protein
MAPTTEFSDQETSIFEQSKGTEIYGGEYEDVPCGGRD